MDFTQNQKDLIKLRILEAITNTLSDGYHTTASINMHVEDAIAKIAKDLKPAKTITNIHDLRRMSAEAQKMWHTKYPN